VSPPLHPLSTSILEQKGTDHVKIKGDHKTSFDIVVNMISAEGVPDCDSSLNSEVRKADAYASFFLSEDEHGNDHLTNAMRTPYRLNANKPVWNSRRHFHGMHNEDKKLYLAIQLFDFDSLSNDDLIGEAAVDITSLKNGEVVRAELKFNPKTVPATHKEKCFVSFSVYKNVQWPTEKTVFFIRHGESKWNEAEHKIKKEGALMTGAAAMASQRDHALNDIGIEQARALNRRWKATRDGRDIKSDDVPKGMSYGEEPTTEDEKAFFEAELIYSSPLTRALQTCLLALEDHPTILEKGVKLQRQLREVKNRIGWDALGKEVGEDIPKRVKEQLLLELKAKAEQLKDLSEDDVNKVTGVKIELNDTFTHWWDPDRDTSTEISDRLSDLIHTLRFSQEKTIICVGHSLFFREMCRAFIGGGHRFTRNLSSRKPIEGKEQQKPEGSPKSKKTEKVVSEEERTTWEALKDMAPKKKLGNGACLMAKFDFSKPEMEDWNISRAKLMFSSTFK